MEYYASKFDLKNSSIFMTNGGQICQKIEDDIYFSLISPQDPNHDLGSAAYKNYIFYSSMIQIVIKSEKFLQHLKIGIFF